MGALLSYFWGGAVEDPSIDIPDPATGLTPRDKRYVTDSWAIVRKDLRGTGIALLKEFFVANPDYVKNFNAFKDVPLNELPENKKFQAHANAVVYAFTSIVDNLDNTEVLAEMLQKLGQNHGRRNIGPTQFNNLRTVLMKLLKDALGQKVMTPEAESAWEKTLDVAYSIIFKGIEETKKSKHVIS